MGAQPPDEAAWRALAERAIGRSVETLRSRSADGLTIEPLYPRPAEEAPQAWRERRNWSVAQRVDHPDPMAANALALADLEGGTDALVLVGTGSPYARGFGTSTDPGGMDVVLDRVELDLIGLRLDAGFGTTEMLTSLAGLVDRRHLASAQLAVDVGFDPIGWQARLGTPGPSEAQPLLDLRTEAGLGGTMFLADGRPWHEAGASEAQELAAVLATAVAYLRSAERLGLSLDDARRSIALLLAADADLFLGLAKFRAIRRLWARVESASGLQSRPVRLHAETSWRMMTRYDPWTNVMRTTAATFAAGLGGADCILVLPFTAALGLPNEAARRLARNTQRVLLDEAHLAMVADPAAGAGSFEALTEALCVEAWRLFQAIERDGGMEQARARAGLKAAIAVTAQDRQGRIATLSQSIVGTSRFASLEAPAATILDVPPRPTPNIEPDALPILRDAEPFEALRDRGERAATAGPRPSVVLATLGAPAEFAPQAVYAANFLAAAGIDVTIPSEEREIDAQVAEFAATGRRVVCLCIADKSQSALTELAARFRAAGAAYVLASGGPQNGVDDIICPGCDALLILRKVLDAWENL